MSIQILHCPVKVNHTLKSHFSYGTHLKFAGQFVCNTCSFSSQLYGIGAAVPLKIFTTNKDYPTEFGSSETTGRILILVSFWFKRKHSAAVQHQTKDSPTVVFVSLA